jgi:hypothetical protein
VKHIVSERGLSHCIDGSFGWVARSGCHILPLANTKVNT